MSFVITEPYQFIAGLDGEALDAGYIYYGEPNKDPIQFPQSVYSDSAMTVPMPQPIRTSGGYIVKNGSPTSLFANGNYSILVLDKHQRQVYFVPDFQLIGNAVAITTTQVPVPVDSIAALRLLNKSKFSYAEVTGYYAHGDGGGGFYYQDSADLVTADNGGTVIVAADGARWKLIWKDSVTIKQFGARTDGVECSARIQAAMDSGVKTIVATGGDYLIGTTMIPPTNTGLDFRFEKNARFMANVNGLTFFKSTFSAYFVRFYSPWLHGNGKTACVGFDMTNMRLYSGISHANFENLDTGFIGREGCFGMLFTNPTAIATPFPIVFINNNSASVIDTPNFDNGAGVGGGGAGNGVTVQGTATNLGAIIRGGYIQGFEVGVFDNGVGTQVSDVYFENCSMADVRSNGGQMAKYSNNNHWGNLGPVAYLLRNTDGAMIWNPTMGSGARSTGLFDVDNTNTTAAYHFNQGVSFYNTPTGVLDFMSEVPRQSKPQTFTPTIAGASTTGVGTYTGQFGKVTRTGNQIHVEIEIGWTAHTGTGGMVVRGIPAALAPTTFTPKRIGQLGVSGFAYTGPMVYTFLNGSGTELSVVQVSTAGAETLISVPATGTLRINLTYDLY